MSNPVLYSIQSGVATISLNRPKRLNAINPELLKTLHDAIQAANDDDNVRVILLRGQGRAFCADVDRHSGLLNRNRGPTIPLWSSAGP